MRIRTAKDLGAAIRQARTERGLKQSELAQLIGVAQARISEIEHGSPGVAVGTILRILRGLGSSITIRREPAPPGGRRQRSKKGDDLVDLDAIANTGLEPWPKKS